VSSFLSYSPLLTVFKRSTGGATCNQWLQRQVFTLDFPLHTLTNLWIVLLMDAGHDVYNVNTTVPVYLARSNEDPQLALDYEVQHYPPGQVFLYFNSKHE
jgi:hypothetical protein